MKKNGSGRNVWSHKHTHTHTHTHRNVITTLKLGTLLSTTLTSK